MNKMCKLLSPLLLIVLLCPLLNAQNNDEDKLNLPGDNLNLYAVLNVFQESETLESFEKNLNAQDSKINNLDLNNDDQIDYIKVADNADGESHLIVLQVAISEKENQDVAVISVNKDENKQIQIQLIGDEDLYGKNYIIEPKADNGQSNGSTPNPGYSTNSTNDQGNTIVVEKTVIVQVETWPVITYVYAPSYVRWNSPWYWGYYPSYWNPWRPYYWDYYYGYHYHWHSHYHGHYHNSHYYRNPLYQNNYYGRNRSQSPTVKSNKDIGKYNNTYAKPDSRKEGLAEASSKNGSNKRPTYSTSTNVGSGNSSNQIGGTDKKTEAKPATKPAVKPKPKPAVRPAVKPKPAPRPMPKPAPRPMPKPTPRPASNLH